MADYLDAFNTGLGLIKDIIHSEKDKKKKAYEAVEAINDAADETMIFLAESKDKAEKPNRSLVDIWANAAKTVRDIDEQMYWRLLGKAEYWSDPKKWPDERVKKENIRLEDIKRDSANILKKKK